MSSARERVEELARTNALGLVGDDDAVWGQCLSSIGQAAHAKLSRTLGLGAPNSVDTTVSAARARALPRPARPGRTATEAEVLRLLDEAPRSSSELATILGADRDCVAKLLRGLVEANRARQIGAKRGAKYTAWQEPGDVPAGLEREECGT